MDGRRHHCVSLLPDSSLEGDCLYVQSATVFESLINVAMVTSVLVLINRESKIERKIGRERKNYYYRSGRENGLRFHRETGAKAAESGRTVRL